MPQGAQEQSTDHLARVGALHHCAERNVAPLPAVLDLQVNRHGRAQRMRVALHLEGRDGNGRVAVGQVEAVAAVVGGVCGQRVVDEGVHVDDQGGTAIRIVQRLPLIVHAFKGQLTLTVDPQPRVRTASLIRHRHG